MQCLRLKLYTPTGIFKNPLSIKGIEVYPLPPYSTIIGLIYSAMGRKREGESFQISIQGDYTAMYRDYVWFRKYNFKDRVLERLPLQVPTLYNLRLLIHIKAEESLLEEMEKAIKEPKELLFLSGGEYPVKVEEVKIVQCEEKEISEKQAVKLNHSAYIPKKILEKVSVDKKGVLFSLSYFYKNSQKPKTYSWIDAYYLQKGTQIYGSLVFDEDGYPVFLTESVEEELKRSEGEEYIKFYAGNWLMASACVGVLKVLEEQGQSLENLVEEKTLKIPKSLWEKLPKIYADYLLKDEKEIDKRLKKAYEEYKNKNQKQNYKNTFDPYKILISPKLRDFHSNSPFTNPSVKHISIKDEDIEEFIKDINQVSEEVKKAFLKARNKLMEKTIETSQTCFFCHERQAKNFVDATTFTPLFASLETVRNFIWDPMPICKECEFLLYFTSVGFYKSGGKYIFVYVPDDLLETYRLNQILSMKEEIEQKKLGRVWDIIEHVLGLEEQKSSWILENIYFVEIEKVGDATANIYSFHIRPNLAKAIRQLIGSYPENLKNIFFEFLFYIYTGRSLYEFLFLLLSGFIRKNSYKNLKANTIESRIVQAGKNLKYLSKNLLFFINFQEVLNMNEQKNYTDLAFGAGKELKALYKKEPSTQKKLEPLTYRLLEAIRRKDKEYFTQNIIRAYLEVGKEIPYLFKEALNDKNFSMIAYAFLIGLNSEEKAKNKDENGESSEPA
ncbi:type I-B CRISPR-associated protein Cas5b [Thermocrinis sp.]|uniref:type I-B CRISPR-associated protein Cas5b n=1 Tax=Thermocrinis sp. TaxID=2024383 RepID=UPI002FDE309C